MHRREPRHHLAPRSNTQQLGFCHLRRMLVYELALNP